MAHCIDCGRQLAPGEGNEPITSSIFKPKGLVCDRCYKKQKEGTTGFFVLAIGLPICAVSSFVACFCLKPIAGQFGFDMARIILVGLGVAAGIIWFLCRRIKSKGGFCGCLVRGFLWIVKFVLIWFAIGSIGLGVFGVDMLKNVWDINETTAASSGQEDVAVPDQATNGQGPQ